MLAGGHPESVAALLLCRAGVCLHLGNSIRQLYEAVIFLFVIHPYDVGDWLKIGTNQYQASAVAVNPIAELALLIVSEY